MYLEEGDVADMRCARVRIVDAAGQAGRRAACTCPSWRRDAAELGPYRHYMQKEIYEQPRAIADTLRRRRGRSIVSPELFGVDAAEILREVNAVLILACGTSYHAAWWRSTGWRAIAGIPAQRRDRQRIPLPRRRCRIPTRSSSRSRSRARPPTRWPRCSHAQGARATTQTLTICNVPRAALVRASRELVFLTRAGPEIGVASTKAFTTQLVGAVPADAGAGQAARAGSRRRSEAAHLHGAAPPAGSAAAARSRSSRRSRPGRERFAEQAARAVPRPRRCTTRSRSKARSS